MPAWPRAEGILAGSHGLDGGGEPVREGADGGWGGRAAGGPPTRPGVGEGLFLALHVTARWGDGRCSLVVGSPSGKPPGDGGARDWREWLLGWRDRSPPSRLTPTEGHCSMSETKSASGRHRAPPNAGNVCTAQGRHDRQSRYASLSCEMNWAPGRSLPGGGLRPGTEGSPVPVEHRNTAKALEALVEGSGNSLVHRFGPPQPLRLWTCQPTLPLGRGGGG